MIVNLAVVADDVTSVGRDHWLMPRRRQVDDRQAPVRQRDSGFHVTPNAMIIGGAMGEAVGHGRRITLETSARVVRSNQYACDAAHGSSPTRNITCTCLMLAGSFDNAYFKPADQLHPRAKNADAASCTCRRRCGRHKD